METKNKILKEIQAKIVKEMNQARVEAKDFDNRSLMLFGRGKVESLQRIYNFTLKVSADTSKTDAKDVLETIKEKIKSQNAKELIEFRDANTKGKRFYANGKCVSLEDIYNFTFKLNTL